MRRRCGSALGSRHARKDASRAAASASEEEARAESAATAGQSGRRVASSRTVAPAARQFAGEIVQASEGASSLASCHPGRAGIQNRWRMSSARAARSCARAPLGGAGLPQRLQELLLHLFQLPRAVRAARRALAHALRPRTLCLLDGGCAAARCRATAASRSLPSSFSLRLVRKLPSLVACSSRCAPRARPRIRLAWAAPAAARSRHARAPCRAHDPRALWSCSRLASISSLRSRARASPASVRSRAASPRRSARQHRVLAAMRLTASGCWAKPPGWRCREADESGEANRKPQLARSTRASTDPGLPMTARRRAARRRTNRRQRHADSTSMNTDTAAGAFRRHAALQHLAV